MSREKVEKNKILYFFSHCLLFLFFTILLCISCTSNTKVKFIPQGRFSAAGFQLTTVKVLHSKDGILFVGTNQGLFKKSLNSNLNKWIYSGLDTDSSSFVDFIIWNPQELLIAQDVPHRILLKTNNGGKTWLNLANSFFSNEKYAHIDHLAFSAKKPDRIFAKAGLLIARSEDRGTSWETVFGKWKYSFSFSKFIKIVPLHPNIIWAGGANNIYQPTLFKSTNGGNTWIRLGGSNLFKGDATVFDVALYPNKISTILAGLSGSPLSVEVIKKSTNGGHTWKTVLQGINVYTFTHSVRTPQVVYASGQNNSGTLFFATSKDFGDTWKVFKMLNSPKGIYVNDMVSVMQNGHEVLYFGTNKGLYSYTFEK